MKYLSLLVAILAVTPAYASQYTHSIEIPPGFTERWQAPKPFKDAIVGNPDVADVLPQNDHELLVTAKPDGGTTNIVLLNENGEQVGNLLVTNPTIQHQVAQSTTKAWQVYRNDDKCIPVCVRIKTRANDRAPTHRVITPAAAPSTP